MMCTVVYNDADGGHPDSPSSFYSTLVIEKVIYRHDIANTKCDSTSGAHL